MQKSNSDVMIRPFNVSFIVMVIGFQVVVIYMCQSCMKPQHNLETRQDKNDRQINVENGKLSQDKNHKTGSTTRKDKARHDKIRSR